MEVLLFFLHWSCILWYYYNYLFALLFSTHNYAVNEDSFISSFTISFSLSILSLFYAVGLHSPGWLWIHNLFTSTSCVLAVCTTIPGASVPVCMALFSLPCCIGGDFHSTQHIGLDLSSQEVIIPGYELYLIPLAAWEESKETNVEESRERGWEFQVKEGDGLAWENGRSGWI